MPMNLYLAAAAIGAGLIAIWLAWLLAVRTYLLRTRSKPGILLSILQVIVVLLLMQLAYRLSDRYFAWMNITAPDIMKSFRRIWILVWGAGMVASIQIFLDIRKMAEPASSTQAARPVNRASRRRRR
ncbi:MAG TPA: hypothetical protein VHY56_07415 [Candidatus Binataceae bacterium]|jgi:hypothetical protein|nr:hypothetical protein [Candidatus Binataceae bacterium]